jgi:Tol biopolymer transport system component
VANVVVSDTALSRVIADLRQALGDSARAPKYIKTVSKKGFHTVAPVVEFKAELLDESNGPQAQQHFELNQQQNQQKPLAWITLLVLICVITLTASLLLSVDSAGSKQTFRPQIISNTSDMIRRPSFSHDGTQLAYSKREAGSVQQVVIQTLAKNLTEVISNAPSNAGLARFSSKQNAAFYMYQDRKSCSIKQYNLAAKTSSDIFDCTSRAEYFGYDVSPDHQFMAIAMASMANDVAQLKIIELATNNLVFEKTGPLSSTKAMMYPRYSPSGDKLAIVTMDVSNQNHNLLVFDIQTQQFNHHETQASVMFEVDWGANDNSLYYLRNKDDLQGIWHLELSSGEHKYHVFLKIKTPSKSIVATT